jgi:hypothetical protein
MWYGKSRSGNLCHLPLDSIMKLWRVSYTWNDLGPKEVQGTHDIGFIADE